MDKVNTNKYIVSQDDPFNVPRWTGDALKESPVEGDNIHVQITKLLGGNPSEDKNVTFYDIPPEGQGLWLSLPWLMNREVAEKEKDWPKASAHLIAHRNDPDVKPLLEKAGLLKAIKPQIERFPDMHAVLYFLGKANLASDANLALLFGNEAWIRAGMMHVGMLIQSAPPAGSNYHAKIQGWLSLLDKTDGNVKPKYKVCAECGKSDETVKVCSGCKLTGFCGPACQQAHWIIHKPECLRTRGKTVKPEYDEEASAERLRRTTAAALKKANESIDYHNMVTNVFSVFEGEPCFVPAVAHDSNGKLRNVDVPSEHVHNFYQIIANNYNLEYAGDVNFFSNPAGLPLGPGIRGETFKKYSKDRQKVTMILIMHTRLFEDCGRGAFCGCVSEGIFVFGKYMPNNRECERTTYKQVPAPVEPKNVRLTRYQKLKSHIEAAALAAQSFVDKKFTFFKAHSTDYGELHMSV